MKCGKKLGYCNEVLNDYKSLSYVGRLTENGKSPGISRSLESGHSSGGISTAICCVAMNFVLRI